MLLVENLERDTIMKTKDTFSQFIGIDHQELMEINGGSAIGQAIMKVAGFVFGTLTSLQVKNGDTGQWMA